jgi:hypothetical protein
VPGTVSARIHPENGSSRVILALRDLLVQLFEVADRLLEDMPQYLHVDELRRRPRRDFIIARAAGKPDKGTA